MHRESMLEECGQEFDMKMDTASPNQSPPLSENSGTWVQCWEGEDSSLIGLNLEATTELNNLVEDKEIASKAVAFVVNSTRKGIVPLCADIANLLRSTYRLENKVSNLRIENSVLRRTLTGSVQTSTSTRTSTSTSPMPASLSSYGDQKQQFTHVKQDLFDLVCSRCSSQCSSLTSNSPKIDKHKSQRSPRLHRTSAFSIPDSSGGHLENENSHVTVAMVHGLPSGRSQSAVRPKKHRRKKSLPEIISEPHENVPKISPRSSKISKEVQCVLETEVPSDPCKTKQLREMLEINARLAEELGAAKKEIEVLKGKLRELEMNDLAAKLVQSDRFHIENEYKGLTVCPQTVGTNPCVMRQDSSVSPSVMRQMCASACADTSSSMKGPVRIDPPFEGCHCEACVSCDSVKTRRPKRQKQVSKEVLGVAMGDHVIIKGQKTGRVMYLGHIEGAQDKFSVFVGLQLDAPVGCHDGVLEGKRYFTSEDNCGMFVPVQEVLHVISENQNPCSKKKQPMCDAEGSCSNGNQSSGNQIRTKCMKSAEKTKFKLSKAPAPTSGCVV